MRKKSAIPREKALLNENIRFLAYVETQCSPKGWRIRPPEADARLGGRLWRDIASLPFQKGGTSITSGSFSITSRHLSTPAVKEG